MVFILLSAVLAADEAATPSNAELLTRAETTFDAAAEQRNDPVKSKALFLAAARVYGELHARGFRNADLYRNEGNAALLGDDLPAAILAYHRGLRLAPNDRGSQRGLDAARQRVVAMPGIGDPPTENRPPWLPHIGLTPWMFALLMLGYSTVCVSLTHFVMTGRRQLLGFGVVLLVVTALLGLALVYADRQEQTDREQPLVVIAAPDVPLRLGNGIAYPSAHDARLRLGAEARLLFRRDDWLQIRLSAGETGWVHVAQVLVDDE